MKDRSGMFDLIKSLKYKSPLVAQKGDIVCLSLLRD